MTIEADDKDEEKDIKEILLESRAIMEGMLFILAIQQDMDHTKVIEEFIKS